MIINPWIFYLIGVAENVGCFLFTLGLFAIIGGAITSIIIFIEGKIELLKTIMHECWRLKFKQKASMEINQKHRLEEKCCGRPSVGREY